MFNSILVIQYISGTPSKINHALIHYLTQNITILFHNGYSLYYFFLFPLYFWIVLSNAEFFIKRSDERIRRHIHTKMISNFSRLLLEIYSNENRWIFHTSKTHIVEIVNAIHFMCVFDSF